MVINEATVRINRILLHLNIPPPYFHQQYTYSVEFLVQI